MSRDHRPRHGSWKRDAREAWKALGLARPKKEERAPRFSEQDLVTALDDNVPDDALRQIVLELLGSVGETRLINLLQGQAERLRGEPKLKKLRKQIRRAARQPAPQEATEPAKPWRYRERTEGMRVLMIGADERVDVRERIQETFGFAELEWETGWKPRRYQSCAERIRSRRYDLVLIIRYLDHKCTAAIVPACKDSGTPFFKVDSGYGVEKVRQAVEMALALDSTA